MFQSRKFVLSVLGTAAIACAVLFGQSRVAHAERDDNGLLCVMDVVVETRNQAGLVVSRETYQKEFALRAGETYSDDFSTRFRFKFFDASHQKVDGVSTIAVNWFADVTVFNSVDFNTSVTLSNGQKSGKSEGNHNFYTSNSSTRTTYSLTCVEN